MNERFRTFLRLGRVSNLPTVWSDCLAGWWLGGAGNGEKLPLLVLGVSLLHTGGMYLNDAFDAEHDRLRGLERPIPAGKIALSQVWGQGFGLLLGGLLLLLGCGLAAGVAATLLAGCIVLYDFTHKIFRASPWLLGACRFWVYIIAGAAGVDDGSGYALIGFPIFGGVALGLYVAGYSFMTGWERGRRRAPAWPLILLAAPFLLAFTVNAGPARLPASWVMLLLGLWVVYYAGSFLQGRGSNIGWVAGNLRAGVVLVDWLAVAPQLPLWQGALLFGLLFGLTKWLQKAFV